MYQRLSQGAETVSEERSKPDAAVFYFREKRRLQREITSIELLENILSDATDTSINYRQLKYPQSCTYHAEY